jgi:hypothetical protein
MPVSLEIVSRPSETIQERSGTASESVSAKRS